MNPEEVTRIRVSLDPSSQGSKILAKQAADQAAASLALVIEEVERATLLPLAAPEAILRVAREFLPGGVLDNVAGSPYFGTLEAAVTHVKAERLEGRMTGAVVIQGYPDATFTPPVGSTLMSLREENIHAYPATMSSDHETRLLRADALHDWLGKGIFNDAYLHYNEETAPVNISF